MKKKRGRPRKAPAPPRFPHVFDAETYARAVISGEIPACKWVILACERHFSDKEKAKSDDFPYEFRPELTEKYVKFQELLPHTKGKWAAKRLKLKLEPWQKFAYGIPFGWVYKETGLRRFRVMYVRVPRKNGKSINAAGTGLYMFTEDSDFGAEIYSGATTEKQAWEVFRPAKLMAERTPELREHFGIQVNASNLARPEDGAKFEPVIGKPGDGASPSCAIIDEYHEHDTTDLYDTMETGMGAREQPLILVITTSGNKIGGPCYLMDRDCQRMLEGVLENPELWAMIYTIDKGDDWTSEDVLRKANPNYGVSVSAEFLKLRQRNAILSAAKQTIFRTKHLDEWVGAKTAWLNMAKWNACPPRKTLEELEGRTCFAAVDMASKIDIAALVLLFPPENDDPLWHLHGNYYTPEQRILEAEDTNGQLYQAWSLEGFMTLSEGETIDQEIIKEDLRNYKTRFNMIQVGYDPFQAAQFARELSDEEFDMVEIGMQVKNLSAPMKEVEGLVTGAKLAHGDCPVMTWMISNVVAKVDAKDNIYPRKERAELKIDGAVATFMAMNRAMMQTPEESLSGFLSNPIVAR